MTFGGIVTAVRSKFTKTGKPCGFVTIEDFNGNGEIALFGEEWGRWNGMLLEGCTIYVSARRQQRFRDSNMYDLRIQRIEFLQTVKEKRIEKITITCDFRALDGKTVEELNAIIDQHPGTARLYIQLYDSKEHRNLLLTSRSRQLDVQRDLIEFLRSHEEFNYTVN